MLHQIMQLSSNFEQYIMH